MNRTVHIMNRRVFHRGYATYVTLAKSQGSRLASWYLDRFPLMVAGGAVLGTIGAASFAVCHDLKAEEAVACTLTGFAGGALLPFFGPPIAVAWPLGKMCKLVSTRLSSSGQWQAIVNRLNINRNLCCET